MRGRRRASMAKRPTLRDVAGLAGVSVTTASNVANARDEEMTPETWERVQQAMRELNYSPNLQARSLRSSRTNTLAFLMLDPDPRFFSDPMTDLILSGVGYVARKRGFMVLVHSAEPDEFDDGFLSPVRQNQVDGAMLLMAGEPALRRRYVAELQTLTPNLLLFEGSADPSVTTATADNRSGAYEVTRRLIERGHRRIAFLGTATPWPMIEERIAGYRAALLDGDILIDEDLLRLGGRWSADTGQLLAADLYGLSQPPTALLAGNDLLAIGALKLLREHGIRVPLECEVVGFDDFEFAQYVDPPLTTVRVPGFELGKAAATKLIDRIEGTDERPESVVLPVAVVVRGSALIEPVDG